MTFDRDLAPFIVGFGHQARVGKDAAAEALAELGYKRIGFADTLKSIAYATRPEWQPLVDRFGWDVVKQLLPEARQFLQLLGTEGVRAHLGEDVWVEAALAKVKPGRKYVFTDVRFPNEAEALLRAGAKLFKVHRPGTTAINQHASELELSSWDWPSTLVNDYRTVEDWKAFVRLLFVSQVEPRYCPASLWYDRP